MPTNPYFFFFTPLICILKAMSSKTPLFHSFFFFFFFFFFIFNFNFVLPNPDPATIQPLLLPNPLPPATIPAFPEQSDISGCSLNLPNELFPSVKSACAAAGGKHQQQLHFSRCCPVLAAWLYAAYSATALGSSSSSTTRSEGRVVTPLATSSYDMPLLPDDSETCVDDLEKSMKERKMELMKPNETCDLVYCYCGIRLHPLSCPESFSVNQKGKLVGDERVKRLERNCINGGGFPGLGGCSKCLNSLHQLHGEKRGNTTSKTEDRTSKMHKTDCQLMGLTWLLAKNRTAYIHTVSAVLRAIMMSNSNGSDPHSCTLTSDGMPLAVDSSEISNQSFANTLQTCFLSLCLVYICYIVLFLTSFN